jgi:hypothetical protein
MLGIFEEEGGKGIRAWLAMWRERQRRASYAGASGAHYHAQAHAQARAYAYAQAQAYSGTAIDPILIEESSDGSDVASGDHHDAEMADSDDLDEEDDYMYDDDEEDDFDEEWSSGEDWDSMAHAIAGMKMADPFALNPGYVRSREPAHAVPMRMESVDPLQG